MHTHEFELATRTRDSGYTPSRIVLVCGPCGGAGRLMWPPYARCEACAGTGYPDGVRPVAVVIQQAIEGGAFA